MVYLPQQNITIRLNQMILKAMFIFFIQLLKKMKQLTLLYMVIIEVIGITGKMHLLLLNLLKKKILALF